MSHVDYVEDKWAWFLRLEYGLRTVVAYLAFGGALGMVQLRHAVMQRRLQWRTWRAQYLAALPDDTDGEVASGGPGGMDVIDEAWTAADVLDSLVQRCRHEGRTPEDGTGDLSGRPDAAWLAQFWRYYWQPLLREYNALVSMAHGEAVHVRLLTVLEKQANALNAHAQLRCQQKQQQEQEQEQEKSGDDEADAAGDVVSSLVPRAKKHRAMDKDSSRPHKHGDRAEQEEEEEEEEEEDEDVDAVFVMSKTDRMASARDRCAFASSARLEFGEAVRLAYLLSEIIACELHCLHALPATAISGEAPAKAGLVSPSCVALMLPNSVEYNSIWLACARAGALETFLGAVDESLAPNTASASASSSSSPPVYRPCATALVNTNLANSAMLFHALECAGSAILILDAIYAPLLFAAPTRVDDDDDASGTATETETFGEVHVPTCVKRIFFWRLGTSEALTPAMQDAIDRFNQIPYARRCNADATTTTRASRTSLKTPCGYDAASGRLPLDLWAMVKPHFETAPPTAEEENTTTTAARLEASRRAWKRLRWLPILSSMVIAWYTALLEQRLSTLTTTTTMAQTHSELKNDTESTTARRTAALVAMYKVAAPRMASALRRFKITEPVLYIYTSGTTGLPKAARFSHLRFFATALLSRLLSMREATRRALRDQATERAASLKAAEAAYTGQATTTTTTTRTTNAGTDDTPVQTRIPRVRGEVEAEQEAEKIVDAQFLHSLDRHAHTARHSKLVVTLLTVWHVIRWLFAWLPVVLGLNRRFSYTETAWQEEKSLSLLTIYNALPMYHTVGCVFCLGHLLHGLEEQQARQAVMRSPWREPYLARHAAERASLPLPSVRMVIRSKYSASNFRADLESYRATVVQYIGEILRYAVLFERRHAPQGLSDLASSHPSSVCAVLPPDLPLSERALLALRNQSAWRVPYAFGNGLRLDIWQECMDRLNVAQPVEFYSSTEGNIFLFNLFNIPGSIGHVPRLGGRYLTVEYLPFFPFRVLRFEEATQDLWRDPQSGFCARVAVGEAGEVCGEVVQGFDMFALRRFDGYHQSTTKTAPSIVGSTTMTTTMSTTTTTTTTAAAAAAAVTDAEAQTNHKLVRHVMWPYADDLFFRSGDLIRFDADGFCFFVDRVGETFRWKGENVSTLEVANALNTVHSSHVGILEAVIYGVTVPGKEGRAGMAMLTLQPRSFHTAVASNTEKTQKKKEGITAATVAAAAGAALPAFTTTTTTTTTTTSPLSHFSLSPAAERRFLQDDLYQFVSGQRTFNGDGSANQAALPPYAVPLFIRMAPEAHGGAGGTGKDSREASATFLPAKLSQPQEKPRGGARENGGGGGSAAPASAPSHSHLRTSTFKYIKHILVKEGYEAALTTSLHDACWRHTEETAKEVHHDDDEDEAGENGAPVVADRYYVLITNPTVYDQLCLPPEESSKAAVVKKGYLPLTRETIELVGEAFDKCGW